MLVSEKARKNKSANRTSAYKNKSDHYLVYQVNLLYLFAHPVYTQFSPNHPTKSHKHIGHFQSWVLNIMDAIYPPFPQGSLPWVLEPLRTTGNALNSGTFCLPRRHSELQELTASDGSPCIVCPQRLQHTLPKATTLSAVFSPCLGTEEVTELLSGQPKQI